MKKSFNFKLVSGFTLVELMVSVAIMMIISSVIVFNHKKFNDNLEITNLSYQVALALRQAQIYGVSTKDFRGAGGVTVTQAARFGTPYGVHFDMTKPTEYIFFANSGGGSTPTGNYAEPADFLLEKVVIGRGNKISKLCKKIGSTLTCYSPPGIMDITFMRPEPEPIFSVNSSIDATISEIAICLVSPGLVYKNIVVYSTGQISIVNGCD